MLLAEPHHSKLNALGMSFVVDQLTDYTRDATHLVQGAVHVENQNGL
jgi:hypothetical protein